MGDDTQLPAAGVSQQLAEEIHGGKCPGRNFLGHFRGKRLGCNCLQECPGVFPWQKCLGGYSGGISQDNVWVKMLI